MMEGWSEVYAGDCLQGSLGLRELMRLCSVWVCKFTLRLVARSVRIHVSESKGLVDQCAAIRVSYNHPQKRNR